MIAVDRSTGPKEIKLISIADCEPIVGPSTVDRILCKAKRLSDLHIVNVSSTYYGGGVAEILSSMTFLMNAASVKTGWRVIQGRQRPLAERLSLLYSLFSKEDRG